MSQEHLQDFFADLASEGTTESSSVGFTLESAKARDKLREFALAHPDSYQLLMVAGLYALGSRQFTVVIDADDLIVTGDHPIERQPFVDLWSYVSRGSTEATVMGYRLLAIALLTSVRFEQMLWTIESCDGDGGWSCQFQVRSGEVDDGAITPGDAPISGVRLSSKRKALGQVARRYLGRLMRQIQGQDQSDERLLSDRIFLPQGGRLEINGKLTTREQDDLFVPSVLAVLKSGEAPDLVTSRNVFSIERDTSLCVLLTDPTRPNDSIAPGSDNRVYWIWNGLMMDSTVLGSGLESFRVFVWAPLLRPDLSFTSLVDNREKQSLERTARDMARELLKRFVTDLTERMNSQQVPVPKELESSLTIVRAALASRIDLARDRNRLASLNRALIACPLCQGSGDDARLRWITFSEVWERLQGGERVAMFANEQEWCEVPAWKGRPLVLHCSDVDAAFFKKAFRQYSLIDATTLADQLSQLVDWVADDVASNTPASSSGPPALSGRVEFEGVALDWCFSAETVRDVVDGRLPKNESLLRVTKKGRSFFIDRSLDHLPAGMTVTAEAPWRPSYEGRLEDRALAGRIGMAVIASAAQALGEQKSPPSDQDIAVASMLLWALARMGFRFDFGADTPLCSEPWLCVTNLAGQRRKISPHDLKALCEKLRSPLYYGEHQDLSGQSFATPEAWRELPILLLTRFALEHLNVLSSDSQDWQGLRRLAGRAEPPWNDDELVWTGRLDGSSAAWISNDIASFRWGVPKAGWSASEKAPLFGSAVTRLLHGQSLGLKIEDLPISPSRVAVDWNTGFPDARGLNRVGGPDSDPSKDPMAQACRHLAAEFLITADPEVILAAHPQTVGSALFETLSEPLTSEACVLLLASGKKVGLADVPTPEGVGCYFTRADLFGRVPEHAVFAPGPMAEALSLLSSLPWIEVNETASALDRVEPAESGVPHSAAPVRVAPPHPSKPVEPKLPIATPQPRARQADPSTPAAPDKAFKAFKVGPPDEAEPMVEVSTVETATPQLVPIGEREEKTAPPEPTPPAPGRVAAKELQSLIDEYLSWPEGQVHSEFVTFLSEAVVDASASTFLTGRGDTVVLGAAAIQAAGSLDGRLALLSALFSISNRQRENITDTDERAFHAQLLRRSLQLERGRSYP